MISLTTEQAQILTNVLGDFLDDLEDKLEQFPRGEEPEVYVAQFAEAAVLQELLVAKLGE